MSANSAEGWGHRPRNNLGSSKTPQFLPKSSSASAQDPVRSHRDYRVIRKKFDEDIDPAAPYNQESSSPAFIFTGQNGKRLSELGNSSSLSFFDSPRSTGSFGAKTTEDKPLSTFASPQIDCPQFTFGTRIPESKPPLALGSSPPPQLAFRKIAKPHLTKRSQSPPSNLPSRTMVIEREPPKAPLSPAKINQQPQNPSQPAFGKTTTLQSPLRTSAFNIPKPNQARPEHHRPKPPTIPVNPQPGRNAGGGFEHHYSVVAQSIQQPKNLFDDQDVVEIAKPANMPSWSSYPARPATFSSGVASLGGFASVNPPKYGTSGNFVDLTDAALFEDRFGAADPYDYIDAGKATENIKALLEGAFDDDEDKPRTRGRKKKLQEDASNLISKLEGLNVGSAEKANEEVPEEDEEEEDDGTVEGLQVELLPHQVDGVEWMREKEASVKKKNGVLPKGGILADDVRTMVVLYDVADCSVDGSWENNPVHRIDAHKSSTAVVCWI